MSKPSRIEILELLSNGKITAAEAAKILSDLSASAEATKADETKTEATKTEIPVVEEVPPSAEGGKEPSWFRVRVANLDTGKNRVSVNIPVRMMKFGLKIGRKFTPDMGKLDWNELNGMIQEMKSGVLVDVQDEDSNEHVQVYLD